MRKLELQNITEKILRKNGINPSAHTYYLKLSMPYFDDLVIERVEEQVLVGHYYHHPSGDLIPDPILAFDFNQGYWYPVRIEQILGEMTCSYVENGKRMVYPDKIKEFRSFQKMFARNIKLHGWLEKGNPIQEAIVCDVFFISKDAPNPFVMGNCFSDYSDPRDAYSKCQIMRKNA